MTGEISEDEDIGVLTGSNMPLLPCSKRLMLAVSAGLALSAACLFPGADLRAQQPDLRAQQPPTNAKLDRALRHSDVQWITVAPHLPDPATGTPAELEMAADVLRARRMPEDALEFYGYALTRGGDAARLTLKEGVTELELQNVALARLLFRRAVKLDPKNAEAWNNLAATEYLQMDLGHSISDYKRAVKLNGRVATFHSNLGTALFEQKSYKQASEQLATALALDPEVFEKHSGNGVMAHMQSPADRGRFCFELAKLALGRGDEEEMLHWLTKSVESGFDLRAGMGMDPQMAKYRDDPRVTALTKSSKALRTQVVSLASIPDLKADPEKRP